MSAFHLPDRSLLLRPNVEEDIAAPEYFADGAITVARGAVTAVVFYREGLFGRDIRRQMLSVAMPRAGFDLSFLTEAVHWQPGEEWTRRLRLN